MKKHVLMILLLAFVTCKNYDHFTTPDRIQLSTPIVSSASLFLSPTNRLITKNLSSEIVMQIKNVESGIEQKVIVQDEFVFESTGKYEIRATQTPFLSSEPVYVSVLPQGKPIASVEWNTTPTPEYFKGGIAVLHDSKNAEIPFQSSGWLGSKTPFQITVHLAEETQIDSITLGVLRNPSSWIYPLAKVQFKLENNQNSIVERTHLIAAPFVHDILDRDFISIPIREKTKSVTLDFFPENLPEDHQGAGLPAWFFMDELIVY